MKIILSRKGYDSSYGCIASPIFDGKPLLSLPIPCKSGGTKYIDLKDFEGKSYNDIIMRLSRGKGARLLIKDNKSGKKLMYLSVTWILIWKTGMLKVILNGNQPSDNAIRQKLIYHSMVLALVICFCFMAGFVMLILINLRMRDLCRIYM